MENEDQLPQDPQRFEPAAGTTQASVLPGRRLSTVGAVVVGVQALLSLDSSYTDTAGISLLIVLVTGVGLLVGRDRPPAKTVGALLILAAPVAVLGLLDFLDVLSNLDVLDEFGGVAGLIGFVFAVVGALLMVWGALRAWRSADAVVTPDPIHPAERLVLIAGVVVVLAWVLMMLAPGWVLVTDQAIAVTAATTAGVLGLLHRGGRSPLSPRGTRIAFVAVGVLVLVLGFSSLTSVLPDRDLIVDLGGPAMYVPYLAYLIGATLFGAAAGRLFLSMRGKDRGRTGTVVGMVIVVSGLALFLSWRGAVGGRPADETPADETPATTRVATSASAVVEGPDYHPVEGCSLLTELEVYEALGPEYSAEASLRSHGGGPWRDTADGGIVSESCAWEFYATTEDWVEDNWVMGVEVGPGDHGDFAPGATLGREEPTEGVTVAGVGDVAMWFPTDRHGIISVAENTRLGVVFVRVLVRQPEVDDAARLEIAKGLAAKVIGRLQSAPLHSVEVNLCDLVTEVEAEQVLAPFRQGRLADVELFGPQSVTVDLTRPGAGAGDSCQRLLDFDIYLEVGQGLATGFEDGVTLDGAVGEAVPGIGDGAIWFPGEVGMLNVRWGDLSYRIELELADTPSDEQLHIAEDLAVKALSRLPGAVPIVTLEGEEHDLAGLSFVDNLVAREESGVWSLGEGLVATLKLLVGEIEVTEVFGSVPPTDDVATEVVLLAEEYAKTGTDETARADIDRLLDLLVQTRDELEPISEPESSAADAAGLLVYQGPFLAQSDFEQQDYCAQTFQATIPCLVKSISPQLEAEWPGKYALYRPKGELDSGWNLTHIDASFDAMLKSANLFEPLAPMPRTAVFLTQHQWWTDHLDPSGWCVINVPATWQGSNENRYKQALATGMARCLLRNTFRETNPAGTWWFSGAAVYMGGVAFPEVNLEWEYIPKLEAEELSRGLLARRETNWIFFEGQHPELDTIGILGLIGGLPDTLDTVIGARWHPFNQNLTDGPIPDINLDDFIPFGPDDLGVVIDTPGGYGFSVARFGVNRLEISIADGKVACFEIEGGPEVVFSFRPGTVDSYGGPWGPPPDTLEGEWVVLITATKADGTLALRVTKLVDAPDKCEEEEAEYVPPPAPECPLGPVCPTWSAYYHLYRQMPEWFKDLVEAVFSD